MNEQQPVFKPRARLLLQLGDQLIRNESIALLELVKNSYDADSRIVSVTMENVDNPDNGGIVVEDDGTGMDIGIITRVWMEPGSDYKENLFKKRKRTEKFGRLPLGEKGIGRFGAHKLGNEIELVTRKIGGKEVVLKIDWSAFEKEKYLNDVKINVFERVPEVFTNDRTGTKIIIKKLKRVWDGGLVRDVYRSLNSLTSPFDSVDSFRIDFKIDKEEWLKNLLSWEDIKNYALFRINCEMKGQHIEKFTYEFTPWPTMKKLEKKKITENDDVIKKVIKMVDADNNPIDLAKHRIGMVKFEAFIFVRSPMILSLGVQDKEGMKKYLDMNGGIRVYRDGVRVYDYGERENDWLNLNIRRVNIPSKRISNNIIVGAVNISRAHSEGLIEKTNREGFVENEAYRTFVGAVIYALEKTETLREIDKDRLRSIYGPALSSEPVVAGLNELKNVVDKKIKDKELKKEVNLCLKRIEQDYRNITEIYLRSAGAGLSLSVVIHEVEKIIGELKKVVALEKPSKKLISLIRHLSQLVEGYSIILKKSNKREEDLKELIDQAVFNVELRLEAHGVNIIKDYARLKAPSAISCARNMVIGTLLNIIDNSIWWLDYADVTNKKIHISVSEEMLGYTCIVIADNGPGFSLSTDEITKPFVSAKPDGMGLGLHIAKTIMESHEGELLFPKPDDFSIPKEFHNGAIVALAFKKRKDV